MSKLRRTKHSKKNAPAIISSSDKSKFYLTRRNQIIAVVGVAIIGTVTLIASHAAAPFASLTASSGTVSGNATVGTDATTSSGSYVQFHATSATNGPINCPLVDSPAAIECWDSNSGIRGADNGKTIAQIETAANAGTDSAIKYKLTGPGILKINSDGSVSWSGGTNPLPAAATTRTVNGVVQHGLFNTWVHNACVINLYDSGQYNDDLITIDTTVQVNGNCTADGSCAASALALGCQNNSSQNHLGFATATYVTADGGNQQVDSIGIGSGGYSCSHCTSTGFIHNWWAGAQVSISESYGGNISDYYNVPAGPTGQLHRETIDADSGTSITVNHNYLRIDPACPNNCGQVNSAMMNGSSYGPASHVTVTNNFLEGGAGADMQEGCGSTYIVVQNNAFSSSNGYNSTDYIYGYNVADTGNVFTGNYIPEQNNAPMANPGNGGC